MSAPRRVLIFLLSDTGAGVDCAFSSEAVAWRFDPGPQGDVVICNPRISGSDDLVIERAVSCWPFGGQGVNRRGSVTLLNGDRAMDELLDVEWRDCPFWLYWCWSHEAADSGFDPINLRLWQSGVIDGISTSDNNRRITFAIADPLAKLDKPVQGDAYSTGFSNAARVATSKPIALGSVRYVPGVLRSTAPSGADANAYDLHEDAIARMTDGYDRGDVFTAGEWEYVQPGRNGIKLVNAPDKPVSFHADGAMVRDYNGTGNGVVQYDKDFRTAGGSWVTVPTGWVKGGTLTCTQTANGCQVTANAAGAYLELSNNLVGDRWNLIELDIAAISAGSFHPQWRSQTDSIIPTAQNCTGASLHTFACYYDASTQNIFRIFFPTASSNLTIRRCTIWPANLTRTLPHFMAWVVGKALGVTPHHGARSYLDWSAITALDAAASSPALGTWISGADTGLAVLTRALDSFTGWIAAKRDGTFTVGRLRERGLATGTLLLDSSNIIGIRRSADTARGLTTRLAGARNHCVHSDSDIALSVTGALRADLSTEWTIREATNKAALRPVYRHAYSARPQETLLQDATQMQTEITRVIGLFNAAQLVWHEVDAAIPAEAADEIEMGDWVHVTHASHGLDAGKWLLCMGATIRFRSRRVMLTLLEITG